MRRAIPDAMNDAARSKLCRMGKLAAKAAVVAKATELTAAVARATVARAERDRANMLDNMSDDERHAFLDAERAARMAQ